MRLTARVKKQVFCMRLTVDMCLTTRVYGTIGTVSTVGTLGTVGVL